MGRDLVEECHRRSLELLRRSATADGFVASPDFAHYAAVWTRDAAVACLGAYRAGGEDLVEGAVRTLDTLARLQSPLGQIPGAYWPERRLWDWGEAGCTDASAWFVIVLADLHRATGDAAIVERLWPSAERAFTWLRYQDANNTGLLNAPEAGDWMDSSLGRGGKVLHVNVLYYWAALSLEHLAGMVGRAPAVDPADVRRRINLLFWPEEGADLAELLSHVPYPPGAAAFPHRASPVAFAQAAEERRFYLSHVVHAAFVDRCDVLANLLGVATGVADSSRAALILDYLDEAAVAEPYPTRTWPEPVTEEHDPWGMWNRPAEAAIPARWRNPPFQYHNGAVWPYVGAFHAAARAAVGRKQEAEDLLERVAAANRVGEWGFHEWLHGRSGEPGGAPAQTWNAGAFVLAYHLLETGARLV